MWLSNIQFDAPRRLRKTHHATEERIAAVAMRERHRNSGLAVPRSRKGVANSSPGSNSISQIKSGIEPALNRCWKRARARSVGDGIVGFHHDAVSENSADVQELVHPNGSRTCQVVGEKWK